MTKTKAISQSKYKPLNTDRILFYVDKQQNAPVLEYIRALQIKHSKDSRIKFNKIAEYITVLSEFGLSAGEPYIKHIESDIWELRPTSDRIFFAAWIDNKFILLHHFEKKTQKTPRREIEIAKKRLQETKEATEKK